MSSLAMSPEVQDRDLAGRKRSHGDFLNQDSCGAPSFRESEHTQTGDSLSDKENDNRHPSAGAAASSQAKSTSSLSEPASSPQNAPSPSPRSTPAPSSTTTAPTKPGSVSAKVTPQKSTNGEPPKKKRLTGEEKAARDAAEKQKKDEEREKKKREKEEAEKFKAQQKAAEKAAKAAEKEDAEKQKAAEKAAKAAEKAEKENEKKQRAEEKEKKKKEKGEEEAKKARSQMKLTNMFNRTAAAPKKELAALQLGDAQPVGATASSEVKETSLYDQMFKPFFVKEHVRLARTAVEMDEETKEAKTRILDKYLSGERQHSAATFEPLEALQIPYKTRRGRVYPSVKKIMAEFEGLSSDNLTDPTTESQKAQMKHTLETLKSVPIKSIKFREDVRPPYIGTISGPPPGMKDFRRLARKPAAEVLDLRYEDDSEAEWQYDDGEDVDDLDDEEEEVDGDEDMDDFLDDSEDVGPARMIFTGAGGIEPESIGPSWESQTGSNAEPKLYQFRLEYVLEPLEQHHSIDPFSTGYWETPKTKPSAGNEPSAASASTPASISASATSVSASLSSAQDGRANPMAPPPAPADAFQALNNPNATGAKKSQQPLPLDMQQKLKDLVRSMPTLSKVGVIELFAASNPGCSRNQIKTSFEALFEKSGKVFKVKGE
ncbi:chromatin assembly factor 1 subunit A-domain-containing protein [Chaetomium sp. MPI-SDFR-AT-0129]|nr:chromatin assembly factor 1 subunit A-domain-containing protein [Chaetomium sp. MPI-SDFR-AT-0129]